MAGKLRKYLSYAILAAFIACVVAVILAKILVTPQRVRNTLVPVVEDYLHCTVNLESVDVSLYSGVALTGLELRSRADNSTLLAADKVSMRYQFWPLFKQRIVIDEVRLEKPRVNIERFADGALNLQQLVRTKKGEVSTEVGSGASDAAGDDSDVDIVITRIVVAEGEVLLKDYSFASVPHRYKFSDLGLDINDFSFQSDFDIKFWGKVNGDPIDIDGIVNLNHYRYDIQVNVSHLDMVQFQPYYRQLVNGHLDSLKFSIDGRVWGDNRHVNSKARVELQQLDLTLTPSARYPVRAANLSVDYLLAYDRISDQLTLDKLRAAVDDVEISCRGAINKLSSETDIDLQVDTEKLSLRDVVALLPQELSRSLDGYDPAGTLSADIVLRGAVTGGRKMLSSATLSLDAVQASIADMRPALTGKLIIDGNRLHSQKLNLHLGDNQMGMELLCDNCFAKKPALRLRVVADEFTTSGLIHENNDELLPLDSGHGGEAMYNVSLAERELSEPSAINLPFNIGGDVAIKRAQVDLFRLTDVRFHYELLDNVLSYEGLRAQLAKGFISAAGQVDLSRQGYVYSGHVDVQKIDLDTLMPQIDADYAETLSGFFTSSFDYSGAGTLRLRMQQNLAGNGQFNIVDGQMRSSSLLKELSDLLVIPELKVFSFSQGTGKFVLTTGGHLHYETEFVGSKARIVPVGSWYLDGTLKSDLDIYLAPQLRDRLVDGKFNAYVQDENGWGFLPLKLSGRLSSPRVQINLSKVKDTAVQRGIDKVLKRAEQKLGGSGDTVNPSAVEFIDSTLKGLLAK